MVIYFINRYSFVWVLFNHRLKKICEWSIQHIYLVCSLEVRPVLLPFTVNDHFLLPVRLYRRFEWEFTLHKNEQAHAQAEDVCSEGVVGQLILEVQQVGALSLFVRLPRSFIASVQLVDKHVHIPDSLDFGGHVRVGAPALGHQYLVLRLTVHVQQLEALVQLLPIGDFSRVQTEPHVGELQVLVFVDQYIFEFEVQMSPPLGVHDVHIAQHFLE